MDTFSSLLWGIRTCITSEGLSSTSKPPDLSKQRRLISTKNLRPGVVLLGEIKREEPQLHGFPIAHHKLRLCETVELEFRFWQRDSVPWSYTASYERKHRQFHRLDQEWYPSLELAALWCAVQWLPALTHLLSTKLE